jgi:hypothetical protein
MVMPQVWLPFRAALSALNWSPPITGTGLT